MKKNQNQKYFSFNFRKKHVRVLLDKVVIFRYMRRLHGRFWGITAVLGMLLGFSICFAIRPELRDTSTAFSDFGNDISTAPFFTASLIFGVYGLWRWRNYLRRTLKRSMPITGLVTLTMFSLYMIAFMPVELKPWPYRVHIAGVILLGISIVLTVVLDSLLSRTKRSKGFQIWRLVRLFAFISIVAGGILTLGSAEGVDIFNIALVGELLMIFGYTLWILDKTYHGEGQRTVLSKMLKDVVLID